MLYKLLLTYFRAKILRIILTRILSNKFIKIKNVRTMNLVTYALELFLALYLKDKPKSK